MFDPDSITERYDGKAITKFDIVPKIPQNYIVNEEGRIVPAFTSKAVDPPWVYVCSDPEKNCKLWHEIMFSTFGVFPPGCKECWKVVVKPRTLMELMLLLEVQEELWTGYCKCGIEIRDYVPANYGGYFYNRSYEEGMECYKEVRVLVSAHINPDIDVVLKRYCTEFELKFGPSDELEGTLERGYFEHPDMGQVKVMPLDEQEVWLRAINQTFDIPNSDTPMPPFVKMHVIKTWFDHAWKIGDMTVKDFFEGDNLYTPTIKYHEEE